ncbi:YkgJ family cysteine cluster protein [Salmonella enterica]|nr:YkgJ family cysteine cluster protein [Salmonella enterica]EJT3914032.1 YkgJ family cysteine cluster protein [Salmonella enterica]ELL1509974.1 YkgJ family cysteine cluster protein [Salmonella enterica]
MNPAFKPVTSAVVAADVPCNGCTLCCRSDAISIHPELGDVAEDYQTEPHIVPQMAADGIVMLAHKPDGSCVYLGDDGCTIHGKAPALCREFDCRRWVRKLGYTKSRKLAKKGLIGMAVVRAGMDRLHTLPKESK